MPSAPNIDEFLKAQRKLTEGRAVIDDFVRTHSHLRTSKLFKLSWREILNRSHFFEAYFKFGNPFQTRWENWVFLEFCDFFNRFRPDFHVPVQLIDDEARNGKVRQFKSKVLITVHTQIEVSIVKAVRDSGYDIATISAIGPRLRHQQFFGISPSAPIIERDHKTLSNTRSALKAGKAVLGVLDYVYNDKSGAGKVRKISLNLATLAERLNMPIVVAFPKIDMDGTVNVHVRELPNRQTDVEKVRTLFRFIKGIDSTYPDLPIGDWKEEQKLVEEFWR